LDRHGRAGGALRDCSTRTSTNRRRVRGAGRSPRTGVRKRKSRAALPGLRGRAPLAGPAGLNRNPRERFGLSTGKAWGGAFAGPSPSTATSTKRALSRHFATGAGEGAWRGGIAGRPGLYPSTAGLIGPRRGRTAHHRPADGEQRNLLVSGFRESRPGPTRLHAWMGPPAMALWPRDGGEVGTQRNVGAGAERGRQPTEAWPRGAEGVSWRAHYTCADTFVAMGVLAETFEDIHTWGRRFRPSTRRRIPARPRGRCTGVCGGGSVKLRFAFKHVIRMPATRTSPDSGNRGGSGAEELERLAGPSRRGAFTGPPWIEAGAAPIQPTTTPLGRDTGPRSEPPAGPEPVARALARGEARRVGTRAAAQTRAS